MNVSYILIKRVLIQRRDCLFAGVDSTRGSYTGVGGRPNSALCLLTRAIRAPPDVPGDGGDQEVFDAKRTAAATGENLRQPNAAASTRPDLLAGSEAAIAFFRYPFALTLPLDRIIERRTFFVLLFLELWLATSNLPRRAGSPEWPLRRRRRIGRTPWCVAFFLNLSYCCSIERALFGRFYASCI